MEAKRRKHRDLIQNIAITLLSVSAVLLIALTQMDNLGVGSYFSRLAGGSPAGSVNPAQSAALSAPVRVAASGDYGRYGSVSLTTADEAFVPLGSLLGEALGSAKSFSDSNEAAFLHALEQNSVYFDFLNPLPLSVLAELTGVAADESEVSARYLALSGDEDAGIFLFLRDGSKTILRCSTAVTAADLSDTVSRFEMGNAFFAFDPAGQELGGDAASPLSLFPAQPPELPTLSITNPLGDTAALLTALGFNSHTNFRNTDTNGTEVIVAGDANLRIQTDGTILYQGGSSPTVKIKSAHPSLTVQEAVTGSGSLLQSLLGSSAGDASLYLESVRQNGGKTVLQFGYECGGIPIRFADGGHAAEITLSDADVTALTLRFRHYDVSGSVSLLLPLRQMLAIAARQPGRELSIGYTDTGAATAYVNWLAD